MQTITYAAIRGVKLEIRIDCLCDVEARACSREPIEWRMKVNGRV